MTRKSNLFRIMFLVFVVSLYSSAPLYANPLRVAVVTKIKSLNPTRQDDATSASAIIQIYEGLFGYDSLGNIVPILVKNWYVSDDRKTYTFILKDNAHFTNGTLLTPENIVQSIENLAGKESVNRWAVKMIVGADEFVDGKRKHIAGVTALPNNTIRIQLKYSYQPFLALLASAYYKIALYGDSTSTPAGCPNIYGTGPYVCKQFNDKLLLLEQNKDYHSSLNNIDKIEVHVMPRPEVIESLNNGRIDFIRYYDKTAPVTYESLQLIDVYQYSVWYAAFNMSSALGKNPNLRKAVSYAFDKQKIFNLIDNMGVPASGLLQEGFFTGAQDCCQQSHDLNKAREFLRSAKMLNNSVIDLLVCKSTPNAQGLINIFSETFKTLGLKYVVSSEEFEKYYSRRRAGDYSIVIVNHSCPNVEKLG